MLAHSAYQMGPRMSAGTREMINTISKAPNFDTP